MKINTKAVGALMLAMFASIMLFACGTDPMNAKLTVENYNAIEDGTTTYDEVVELFGEPQSDQTLTDGDGSITWSNKDESITVTITFEDEVVTNKAQTGLI